MTVYLDHNATSPLLPAARHAMEPWLGAPGNPASLHGHGQAARAAVDEARRRVKALVGGPGGEVVFTGTGTEAICTALTGAVLGHPASGAAISAVEHAATIEAARQVAGAQVVSVAADSHGRVDLDALSAALQKSPRIVSLLHANNETGVIQPVDEAVRRCRERGVLCHIDAVQSAGKIPVEAERWGADMVSVSAHKLGGPQGVGALWLRAGLALPALVPGAQEGGRRGGTLNVPGIVGFGAAAVAADPAAYASRWMPLRTRLEEALHRALPGVRIHGEGVPRLANTVQFTLDPAVGGDLVPALDMAGFSVSAGSACASGSEEPSRVLLAMGVDPGRARTAVRVSLGSSNTEEDIEALIVALGRLVQTRTATGKVRA